MNDHGIILETKYFLACLFAGGISGMMRAGKFPIEETLRMSDKTFEVTEATFESDVLKSEKPVLIDFWAEWCTPCRMIAPLVDQLATKYGDKLRVGKVDADTNQGILMQYGILGIPTLILFKDGKPVERITGYMPLPSLEPKIAQHLG
jgi:thioredoxin 1